MLLRSSPGFFPGGFFVFGEKGSDFSVFRLQKARRSVSLGCFHLLKVKCCGQTSRETGKLLKSSLGFFPRGFFVSGEGIRFFSFPLAFRGEIRILGTRLFYIFFPS